MSTKLSGPVVDVGEDVGRGWFLNLPVQYNPDYVVLFDDFEMVAVNGTNDWTVVKDSGASVAIEADIQHGVLDLSSTATTDNDGASIQGNEIFAAQVGKNLWFEAYVKLHDANDCDMFVGLCENFATDPEACLLASNRIGFQVTEGDAALLCKSEATDAENSTDSQQNAADGTWVRLGFHLYSTTHIYYYVNRVLVATHTSDIPTANMTPAFFALSGSATGTFVNRLDYILVVAER